MPGVGGLVSRSAHDEVTLVAVADVEHAIAHQVVGDATVTVRLENAEFRHVPGVLEREVLRQQLSISDALSQKIPDVLMSAMKRE